MPIHGYPGNVITANPVAPTSTVATGVWTTEQQLLAVSQGNWPGYEYPLANSLRFNSADSAYLNRTPASTSNRQIWTYSAWVKRASVAASKVLLGAVGSSRVTYIWFNASNNLGIYSATASGGGDGGEYVSSAIYRDPSAWYHIVVAYDSTQATSTNRIKAYVNGSQITAWATATAPTLNHETQYNWTGAPMQLGAYNTGSFFDGYMTEVNFVDGQALTPSSFGLNDPETGVWSPKRYTGTYGTNGFYLNFSDNSGTTSTTLGKDYSGNGNNWTPNNFSVTAGAGNDSLVDSPTNYGTDTGVGGEVRGNYCTLTPLVLGSLTTLSNGNLQAAFSNWNSSLGTMAFPTTGKWYYEVLVSSTEPLIGIAKNDSLINSAVTTYFTQNSTSYGYYTGGSKHTGPGNSSTSYGASFTSGDLIGVALDSDNGTLTFYKNGSSQGTAFTSLVGPFLPVVGASNGSLTVNFGQRAFAYTAPSGFKALCTQNLPTPTIGATSTTQANRYMDIKLYTGNGGQQTQTGLNFQPDFIWVKSRNNAYNNGLANAVTGTGKYLVSNSTAAEVTDASGSIIAFNADGFGQGGSNPFGANAATYVAWCWRASNAAGVTNTAGTITSTVSANTTSGFSIVTWTGTGSAATVGHGLGVAPSMIIVKVRNNSGDNWGVYHSSIGNTGGLLLNLTNATGTNIGYWNNTSPTSSVFSVGSFFNTAFNYVAYCFSPVADYSAFGSYVGNGSADGPFIYTGFKPNFVMVKQTNTSGNSWWMFDGVRSPTNAVYNRLAANLSDAEYSNSSTFDFLSNGFKLRFSDTAWNGSGSTYIYACFAESPFKYSLAR